MSDQSSVCIRGIQYNKSYDKHYNGPYGRKEMWGVRRPDRFRQSDLQRDSAQSRAILRYKETIYKFD
jgi:hypothetical protein